MGNIKNDALFSEKSKEREEIRPLGKSEVLFSGIPKEQEKEESEPTKTPEKHNIADGVFLFHPEKENNEGNFSFASELSSPQEESEEILSKRNNAPETHFLEKELSMSSEQEIKISPEKPAEQEEILVNTTTRKETLEETDIEKILTKTNTTEETITTTEKHIERENDISYENSPSEKQKTPPAKSNAPKEENKVFAEEGNEEEVAPVQNTSDEIEDDESPPLDPEMEKIFGDKKI